MIKHWSELDTFERVLVVMGVFGVLGFCTFVAGYETIGGGMIYFAAGMDAIAIIIVVGIGYWRKRKGQSPPNKLGGLLGDYYKDD